MLFVFFSFFWTDLPPAGKFAGLRSFQRLIHWETCLIGVIHQIDCFITHFIIYSCTRGWCSHLLHIQVGGFIPIGGFSLLQHPLFVRTAAETKAGNCSRSNIKGHFCIAELHAYIKRLLQSVLSYAFVLCIFLCIFFARNKHGAFETKRWKTLKIRPSETSFSTQSEDEENTRGPSGSEKMALASCDRCSKKTLTFKFFKVLPFLWTRWRPYSIYRVYSNTIYSIARWRHIAARQEAAWTRLSLFKRQQHVETKRGDLKEVENIWGTHGVSWWDVTGWANECNLDAKQRRSGGQWDQLSLVDAQMSLRLIWVIALKQLTLETPRYCQIQRYELEKKKNPSCEMISSILWNIINMSHRIMHFT